MKRPAFFRFAPIALAATLAGLGTYACSSDDPVGPSPSGSVVVTLRPVFQADAAARAIPLSRAHVVVRRADQSIALDTIVQFTTQTAPNQIVISVPLGNLSVVASDYLPPTAAVTAAQQTGFSHNAIVDLLNGTGTALFHSDPIPFNSSSGTPPPPVDVSLQYVGPGSTATRVEVSPVSTSALAGAAVDFVARAFDNAGVEQPSAPVHWSSMTSASASVPSANVGRVIAGPSRGNATIRATLLGGQTGDATLTVNPVATTLALQSGSGQTGSVGAPVAQPLVAKVTAADGLGVAGVQVAYAIQSGGGTLGATQATTNSDGLASVGYTFSNTPGPVTVNATATGLSGSPVAFTLTGTQVTGSQLAFTSQPTNAVAGTAISPAIVVEARDQAGARLTSFTSAVTLAFQSAPSSGSQLQGTLTVNAVAGVATFTSVSGSLAAPGVRLVASAPSIVTGATSNAFDILPRPAVSLVFLTPPPLNQPAGDPFGPIIVEARDATGALVTTYTGNVGLTLDGSGVGLQGTTVAVAVNGVATFSSLSVPAPASPVRLAAQGSGITGTFFSGFFNVGPPSNPLVANPPVAAINAVRTQASPAPVPVQLTSSGVQITALTLGAIQYGPGAAGWLAAGLSATTTPSTLTLTATTGTLPEGVFTATVPITGSDGASMSYAVTLTVAPLPVTQLAIITQPSGAASGSAFVTQPVIELRDATGTRVFAATNMVTATIASGTGALTGTFARAAVQGRVNYTGLVITGTPGAFTLAFNSPTLTGVTSAPFAVAAALSTTQAVPATTGNAGLALTPFTPVTAAGGVPPYVFALSGGALPAGVAFNPATGQITGTPATPLATTTFTVTVTDAALVTSFKTFQFTVNGPLTTTQAIASRALTQNTAAVAFTPVTAAGGTVPYAFVLTPPATLPAGLVFNGATGQITGTPTATLATTTFTVTVTDNVGAVSSKTFDLTVNTQLTTTQAVPATAGTVNTAIPAFTPVTAAGGTVPRAFVLSGGTLPTGMAFNGTTGQITGTPTTTLATTTFTVTVTDAAGAVSAQTFQLTVNPALTTTQAVPAIVGNQGNVLAAVTPVTAAGGTPPYAFVLTPPATLPTGLAFDGATGQITGTPTAPLVLTTFTVTVTDLAGAVSSKTFNLTVNGPLTTTQAIPARVGTQNAAIASFIPVTAAGGTTPYTFVLTPPATLPAGLTFSGATGAIVGTPTAVLATTTFTVTVTDNVGAISAKTFDLTINPALTTTQAVPTTTTTVNVALTPFTPVTAANGTVPYAFVLSGGALPTGVTFSGATGQITGTPTTVLATTTFTVTVTDAAGAVSAKTFQLTVNGPLTTTQAIPARTLTQNTAATAFTPVTAAGGTPPYAFVLTPPATLPAGLAFNGATGQITGTPTATLATTTFTVTVTDNVGAVSSKTFDLTVNTALTTTQAVPATVGTRNTAIPAFIPVTAAGGTAPLAFVLTPPATLPAGMAFNGTTGQVTGTPTAVLATTTFTVTVTDAVGAVSSKTFQLTVNPLLTATQAVPSTVGNVNIAIPAFTPVTGAGGTVPYTFVLSGGTLPTGMAFDGATGQVTGTPTTPLATTTFTVTITDAATASAASTFNLTVNGPLTTNQAVPVKVATQNTAVASFIPVTAAGGTVPYAFALTPPATLPAGLVFNTGTGAISGTPTATLATTTFTVTVTDGVSATSFKTFDLTVNTQLTTTQAVPATTGVVNTALTPFTPVTAAGGSPPLAFVASGGVLPTGVTLDGATGQISGTPTATLATTTFTMTVTDAVGAVSSKTFQFTVNPALSAVQSVPNTVGNVNITIAPFIPVTGAGGVPPYSYAITAGGALPAGLTFNPVNGQITGTPTATQALTAYTVTVTDAALVAAANTFNLTVNAEPPGIKLNVGAAAVSAVAIGNTVSIPILFDLSNRGADDIASTTIEITWDPTKFTFNAASAAGAWPGGGVTPGAPGASSIRVTGFSATGATTSFTMYTLVLNTIATGTGGVSAAFTTSPPGAPANELGAPITVTIRNHTVTINP